LRHQARVVFLILSNMRIFYLGCPWLSSVVEFRRHAG